MKNYRLIFSIVFISLLPKIIFAMEFTAINRWSDAEQFAGKLVAFETKKIYYGIGKGFNFFDETNTRYAIVAPTNSSWDSGEIGFDMKILLRPEDTQSTNALTDTQLEEADMKMRLSTLEENDAILRLIQGKEAYFDFCYYRDDSMRLLQKALQ